MAPEVLAPGDQLDAGDYSPAVKPLFLMLFPLLLLFLLLRCFSAVVAAPSRGGGARREPLRLPPSPPALPLIGHLHLVGALPHVSLRRLAARHGGAGGLMMLRLGAAPTLVASSPRAARAVLRTHDQSFASRPWSLFGVVLAYGPSDVGFAPYGEPWRQAKKLVTTHLLSSKKVQSYRAAREEEVGLVIAKIKGAAATRTAVDMSELLSTFTNNMVCRAVAGRSFRVEGRDKVFRDLIDAGMVLLGGFNPENFYPGLAKFAGGVLMWPARRRAERLRDRWDELLDKIIDEHMTEDNNNGDKQESDFVHVLLSVREEYALTRDSIKAILADMFAAGTDTAHQVLEFTMAELMLNKGVMARLQAEVRSMAPKGQQVVDEQNVAEMTYLKAVIKETLRLHPPSPLLLPHLCLEDCDVGSYTVPAGTTIFVNAWAIGRDPKIWDDAEKFVPERFLHRGDVEGADFRGTDFQFLPFGSGRRMCPGMNFALASVETMLANLVYHFDWELPRGVHEVDMSEVFRLTVCRKEKLLLTPNSYATMHQL